MKLSEKKELYNRFLNQELDEAGLDLFFQLVERGEIDLDAMPEVDEVIPLKKIDRRKPVVRLLVQLSVAASLLLLAGLGFLTYRKNESNKQQALFTTVRVPVGKMKIITLADHSVVTLVSGAVFRYPAAFSPASRKVYMISGKGFFEIAKDKKRPFTVYAAKLSTTALGTSFTVESYPGYNMEKVQLFTGKVRIGSRDHSFPAVQLSPGQQYSHYAQRGIKSEFTTAAALRNYTEEGTLAFENTAVPEALMRIASYYNITIRFEEQKLKAFKINGAFKNEPVEDVLQTLLFTHHLKLKKIPEGYAIMN
jgi:transmembrane sensor